MSEKTETSKRGRVNYNSVKLTHKKERKRLDAEARNREYQNLSLTEKLKRAKSRRGDSKKEVERLTKAIASVKK